MNTKSLQRLKDIQADFMKSVVGMTHNEISTIIKSISSKIDEIMAEKRLDNLDLE